MEELFYENEEGTFTASYRKARSHHMPANHFHGTYEIFYLMSGKREFFIQDRTLAASEGDVIIIAPNILHRTTNTEKPAYERLVVNIHESLMTAAHGANRDVLLPLLGKEYAIVRGSLQERLAIDALAQGMLQELREKKPGFEMYALTLVQQLLLLCCRQAAGQSRQETPESPSPMHERISEVVRYINDHYMHELSLQLLSEKFYISPYYLSRFFKEATGFTFVEYLNSVRVKEAKKLLEESAMKANLIAKKVGFGSVAHFGRVFKQVTGHAPLHFRKEK
ncbi:AraC family transcriptional regulator [Cohnella thailandensis]|uniref:Helix-turn-helix transcriptional regulator n=1 Tax=Cohnella thailandensis TaxID=557557 RepID=A0A841T3C4_9BACL|nr:AraC family transcriptional regulator [Cohnella thailandensis]MBB6637115.1 helix-turn-helix transcriptional regulator [Cohnella thailandensis]MBP1977068.1 AraC-like DNA-binding protein [Cohnella thailandensis]